MKKLLDDGAGPIAARTSEAPIDAGPAPATQVVWEYADHLLAEFEKARSHTSHAEAFEFKPAQDSATQPILTAPPQVQAAVAVRIFTGRIRARGSWSTFGMIQEKLLQFLLRKNLPFSETDIEAMLAATAAGPKSFLVIPIGHLLSRCEALKAAGRLTEPLRVKLKEIAKRLGGAKAGYAEGRKFCARIASILSANSEPVEVVLHASDSWAALAEQDLGAMPDTERAHWRALFAHARTAIAAQPSARWLKQADPLLAAIGAERFTAQVGRWFGAVGPRPTQSRTILSPAPPPLEEGNSDVLKGLAWCCTVHERGGSAAAVSDLAAVCYRKIPDVGPVSSKVGNACLIALEKMDGLTAVAQLSRLGRKIKYAVAQRLVQRALESAAQRAGLTIAELEEIALPTFGLSVESGLDETLASFTAEVRITPQAEVLLTWRNAEGKSQKAVPSEVKSVAADEWKALKRTVGEIETLLAAQRDRIDRLFRVERSWRFPDWCERYLHHPLVAPYARRLIWQFSAPEFPPQSGIWHSGRLVDVHDEPLPEFSPDVSVKLWHPMASALETVQAWREWLIAHEVSQPMKQAHREIYLLTDAERTTATYSNRFAAHILRQHQFAALAQQRGWKYRLQGAFDSANTPEINLPEWNLRAEYWVEAAPGDGDASESGIYLYIASDQVRFCRGLDGIPLTEVPPLIFSEIMRDVDLFVGVTSVGNDPTWGDQGEAGRHTGAWTYFAFGELSATAKTRRELLERLVPKLKIAAQCSFEERFLIVRGKLRTYKIHLGSGNILMAPNDLYLCIVPARGKAADDKVFLPFEGDGTLSVILSKAFLLAADDKITDPTIVRQIGR